MKARSQIALIEEKHTCQNIVTFNCCTIYPFSEARVKELSDFGKPSPRQSWQTQTRNCIWHCLYSDGSATLNSHIQKWTPVHTTFHTSPSSVSPSSGNSTVSYQASRTAILAVSFGSSHSPAPGHLTHHSPSIKSSRFYDEKTFWISAFLVPSIAYFTSRRKSNHFWMEISSYGDATIILCTISGIQFKKY